MASELCMNCFSVKGQYEVCPFCGYVEGTPPAQPHYLTPGTILGNHFIVGTAIGFGGFGITYKCFDTTLGVTVAAKEFYPVGLVNRSPGESRVGLLSGDKRELYRLQLQRFLMEAQSVAQFGKAKDIVNIYDFFEENGTAYIIMEYIDGVLLKDYLDKQGAMPPNVAMSVIMPIIEAVKKIHSKGIIHRDISPDNIFITDENSIKIFDFGAAQLNDSQEGMAGEKVIKVGYSAPEQYRDKSRQGFYTDIYSVGAIMYQLLTGRKPIESTEREYKDELKSPMELGVKVNSNIDRAVMEALAVRPELRFQGIQQFEDALRSKRVAEYPKEKIRKRKRKRNWIISTVTVLVLAIGVSIGLFSTVLRPESKIFDTAIEDDTVVNIWVENEDQRDQLDDLLKNGFVQGELESENQQNPEQWEEFWEENEKVSVNVTVHPDIQADLQAVSEEEKPNMYITDHVSDSYREDLVSLEDVYVGINTDDYAYMSEYEKHFPDYEEMPTGLDTLLVYVSNVKYYKDNTLKEESAIVADEDNTVELEDLIGEDEAAYVLEEDAGTFLSNQLATFEQSAIPYALFLNNEKEWSSFFECDESFVPNVNTLSHIQTFNNFARVPDYTINKGSGDAGATDDATADGIVEETTEGATDDGASGETEEETSSGSVELPVDIYGNNVVAGVAYRKVMENALKKTESEEIKVNSLEEYQTYVVTHDGKMLVQFSERYGITKASTDDQETACMRILYLMMQERAQSKKVAFSSETTLPIRKKQLDEFSTIKVNMKDFVNLFNERYSCEILSDLTGNMYEFTQGLAQMATKEELQNYCNTFISSKTASDESDDTKSEDKADNSESGDEAAAGEADGSESEKSESENDTGNTETADENVSSETDNTETNDTEE